jgi:sarcosine oxidase/L-pipecolate oxidase
MFVIPPRNNTLKVAAHTVGYINNVLKQDASGKTTSISVPITASTHPGLWIPKDAEERLAEGIKTMIPSIGGRPFSKTKLCWYTDTYALLFSFSRYMGYFGSLGC